MRLQAFNIHSTLPPSQQFDDATDLYQSISIDSNKNNLHSFPFVRFAPFIRPPSRSPVRAKVAPHNTRRACVHAIHQNQFRLILPQHVLGITSSPERFSELRGLCECVCVCLSYWTWTHKPFAFTIMFAHLIRLFFQKDVFLHTNPPLAPLSDVRCCGRIASYFGAFCLIECGEATWMESK